MTKREMQAFLRAEGWFIGPGEHPKPSMKGFKVCKGSMIDPVKGDLYGSGLLDICCRLAHRRKSQREARALRKAGWVHCGSGCWAHWKRRGLWHRTQALRTLAPRTPQEGPHGREG